MNILPFTRDPLTGGFDSKELRAIGEIGAPALASGIVSDVAYGTTERGEPQAYFLGNGPDQECVLCISRIGRRYIIEDGCGTVLAEVAALRRVAEKAARFFHDGRARLATHLLAGWVAAREFFEEKVEPAMAESMEAATHFAPQLAALI
jgi:hypothetical protein